MFSNLIIYTFFSTATLSAFTSTDFIPAKRVDLSLAVWKSLNDGNTAVRFGDVKVSIGSCSPKDVLNIVYNDCYGKGLFNSAFWSMQFMQGNKQRDIDIYFDTKDHCKP